MSARLPPSPPNQNICRKLARLEQRNAGPSRCPVRPASLLTQRRKKTGRARAHHINQPLGLFPLNTLKLAGQDGHGELLGCFSVDGAGALRYGDLPPEALEVTAIRGIDETSGSTTDGRGCPSQSASRPAFGCR